MTNLQISIKQIFQPKHSRSHDEKANTTHVQNILCIVIVPKKMMSNNLINLMKNHSWQPNVYKKSL